MRRHFKDIAPHIIQVVLPSLGIQWSINCLSDEHKKKHTREKTSKTVGTNHLSHEW